MANIVLSRVDSRLIHGQVITKWIKQYPAKRIMIIDDELAKDSFMAEIYMMAAPTGIKVEIVSVESAGKKLQETDENVFILYKTIGTCFQAYKAGVPVDRVIVGGVPSAPGKKFLLSGVYLGEDEIIKLKEMDQSGIEIIARVTPEEQELSFPKMMKKL